jgi:hypothetical protein
VLPEKNASKVGPVPLPSPLECFLLADFWMTCFSVGVGGFDPKRQIESGWATIGGYQYGFNLDPAMLTGEVWLEGMAPRIRSPQP